MVSTARSDGATSVRSGLGARPRAWSDLRLRGKGAVLVATSNDAGNELALTLDAPEGIKELVAKVPVTRSVHAIKVESGYPELHFSDLRGPSAARISRKGALIEAPR